MAEDSERPPAADPAARKRLRLRSWRRGMREMDLLLGPFADEALAAMGEAELADYAALLEVDDPELYRWIVAASAGAEAAPPRFAPLVARIAAAARARVGRI